MMYLSMLCSFILLISFGVLAQSGSVTVNSAAVKLGENAVMMYTFTPATGEELRYIRWYLGTPAGKADGNVILSNFSGMPGPNGRYSLNGNGDLVISDVQKIDINQTYVCLVSTSASGTFNGFATLTVNYLDMPVSVIFKEYVCKNENANILCSLPDGHPTPITITWIKNGNVLVSDTEKYPQSDTTLKISEFNEMDEGDYQCRAENAAYSGDEGKLSDNVKLILPYVSTTTVEPKEEQVVTEFQSFSFTCVTDATPKPLTITWVKDGVAFDVSNATTLDISEVRQGDAGYYQCRVKNAGNCNGDDGKLSINNGTLSVTPDNGSPSPVIIIVVVVGLVVLAALIVGGFSYKYDKLCFSRNAKKASGGGSENIGLNSNFSDVDINTYAQVQKPKPVKATKSEHSEQAVTQTKPPDKPQRAPSRDRANVEQLTYADLDLVKSEGKIIHTDPETEYSSVRTEKQLTFADLDLTKDVNTGSKDKIIRTQPETEYSSVMITKK